MKELYKHKQRGHIVRKVMECYEYTERQSDESRESSLTQIIAQRQKEEVKLIGVEFVDDKRFLPFCMERDTFNKAYEEIK